jgi:hypothetical protein
MLWATLLALTALANAAPATDVDAVPAYLQKRQGSQTMLRFGCAQVVIDRLDPLVNPGQAPSPHNHQVRAGMNPSGGFKTVQPQAFIKTMSDFSVSTRLSEATGSTLQ